MGGGVATPVAMEYRARRMASMTLQCRIGHAFFPGLVLALAAVACGSDGDGGGTAAAGNAGSGAVAAAGSSAGTGGAAGAASAGASGSGGSGGVPSSGGNTEEGPPDVGGLAGATGSAGTAGGESSEEPAEPAEPEVVDERPFFSFFVTSQAGLFSLPAGEFAPAPDPEDGYGGNLGGLAGADEICTMLARASNPTDQKTWRAFLSTSGFDGGERVDAIDRIGEGPWYDLNGRLLAENLEGLAPDANDGRPEGDPNLIDDFTTELGEPVRPGPDVENHDTLTGSNREGRLHEGGATATCNDWTSTSVRGAVPVGHSWPRSSTSGRHWIFAHTVNGCEPGVSIDTGDGVPDDDYTVGSSGGFGAIYCFALGATPPP